MFWAGPRTARRRMNASRGTPPFRSDPVPGPRPGTAARTRNPEGGNVIIGTCITAEGDALPSDSLDTNLVYIINGDTGAIEETVTLAPDQECFYGGAMDYKGWIWLMEGFGYPRFLKGINTINTADTSYSRPLTCGYGITVDPNGRVWTGGKGNSEPCEWGTHSCIQRIDPESGESVISEPILNSWLRGIAVGSGLSENYVWATETSGNLYKINMATVEVEDVVRIRGEEGVVDANGMIGVAIDLEGYIWTISAPDNACYKYDPTNGDIVKVVVGTYPYTYSDMTGMQLRAAVSME